LVKPLAFGQRNQVKDIKSRSFDRLFFVKKSQTDIDGINPTLNLKIGSLMSDQGVLSEI
jgi:hypothetical protein